jgi:hypothetical protein
MPMSSPPATEATSTGTSASEAPESGAPESEAPAQPALTPSEPALTTDPDRRTPAIAPPRTGDLDRPAPVVTAPPIPGSAGTTRPTHPVPGTAWMAGPTPSARPLPAARTAGWAGTRTTRPTTPAGNPGNPGTPRTSLLLIPDLEQRAHHLPLELVRRDIAGDHPGVPLMLRIRVLDDTTGDPVNAVLDIRHWDALGRTQVRGAQVNDSQGYAEFRTVHPGWQAGEPVHILVEVHVGGYLAGGRSIAHTGRLTLPESLTAEVAQLPPYRGIRAPRPVDEHASTLNVVPRDRFDLASGLLASIVVAVTT